jgi:AcrR family transcriptional regulator
MTKKSTHPIRSKNDGTHATGRNKKLSRETILAEAKKRFSAKGYRGTTLGDLTASFGVSRPSIYYYFKSKVDLLSELHNHGYTAAVRRFDEIFAAEMPTREKLRRVLEVHARNLAEDAALHKIFFLDISQMPEKVIRDVRKKRREYTDKVIAIYRQGVAEGIFKDIDPELVVYLLLGACNWVTMWYSPTKSVTPDTVVDTLMTLLCEGYEK